MKTKPICPICKSENVVKRGISHTKRRGKQQRYQCKSCKKTFIRDLGFWKMKNKEKIITMAIDMYISNLSSRKMRNQIYRHFGLKVSHVTILAWVRKYIQKVLKFVSKLKPKLSGKIYADETEVDCENRNDVFWCSVDWGTRFIPATLYSPRNQNLNDAVEFMKRIKEGKPNSITTDAAGYYPNAFRKIFEGYHRLFPVKVSHFVNNHAETKKHNVRIETVFSKIKDRVKDFRGFKSIKSAPILMAGIVLQHNFIEEHMGIGKPPCEMAGLKLKLGFDRWMGLIRLAVLS